MADKKTPSNSRSKSNKSKSKSGKSDEMPKKKRIPQPPKSHSIHCSIATSQIVKPSLVLESDDKRYDRIKLVIPARHDKHFGMGIINSNGKVIISTVAVNSIASDYFVPKDHLISINGVHITDKSVCKQLILSACSSAPEFEIVIERLKKEGSGLKTAKTTAETEKAQISAGLDKNKPSREPESATTVTELEKSKQAAESTKVKQTAEVEKAKTTAELDTAKTTTDVVVDIPDLSFIRPLKDPDCERGNPLDGFHYAPADVREILRLRTKTIVADFMPPYRCVAKAKTDKVAQFNLSDETHLSQIASDVPMDKPLMKPRK